MFAIVQGVNNGVVSPQFKLQTFKLLLKSRRVIARRRD
jgi:hypothetical protein